MSILTDFEIDQLVLNVLDAYPDGLAEARILEVIEWAGETRTMNTVLNLAIEHKVAISFNEAGELQFKSNAK